MRYIAPGWVISLITFPGIVLHEMSHRWFCWLFHVPVEKVCYFRFGSPAGYVVYETPQNTYHHIWICAGPFVTNTIIGVAVAFYGSIHLLPLWHAAWFDYVLIWLGVSIAMHSFPSTGDARSLWRGLWGKKAPFFARLIGTPIVGIIYLGALGSFFWLDLVYGAAVAVWAPRLLMNYLAGK
ncbi:MAG: metalloprotease family protein [Armatimonadetes bacterium]|nr:metalloprotease family protein [Armatimonadota bacterium]